MFQRTKYLLIATLSAALMLVGGTAFAGDTGSVATMDEPTRLMSITFSPIHLALPIVEITGEFKAQEQWGLAFIGGYGSVTSKSDVIGEQNFSAWEVGGQLRYYALGDFDHGLQLGAEVLYARVENDHIETSGGSLSGVGSGVSVGPFVGYKIATQLGFTFDAQLGVARMGIGAEAKNETTGQSASDEDSQWGPLLNLNVGWSF